MPTALESSVKHTCSNGAPTLEKEPLRPRARPEKGRARTENRAALKRGWPDLRHNPGRRDAAYLRKQGLVPWPPKLPRPVRPLPRRLLVGTPLGDRSWLPYSRTREASARSTILTTPATKPGATSLAACRRFLDVAVCLCLPLSAAGCHVPNIGTPARA